MFNSSDFLLGIVIYQSALVFALVGASIYLLVSFQRHKEKANASIDELTTQNKELFSRISQIQALFAIMDTLAPVLGLSGSKSMGPAKPGNKTQHNIFKIVTEKDGPKNPDETK